MSSKKTVFEAKSVVLGDNNNAWVTLKHIEETLEEDDYTISTVVLSVASRIDTQFNTNIEIWGVNKKQFRLLIEQMHTILDKLPEES